MRAKGPRPLHERLRKELRDAWQAGRCTQESLARAIGKTQTSVGQYLLLNDKKSGPLDLDEASAALEHIGSTLAAFLADAPPHELSPTDRLARELEQRPMLLALVEDLIDVPRTRLSAVIELARAGVHAATGRPATRIAEHHGGRTRGTRTTPGATRRR